MGNRKTITAEQIENVGGLLTIRGTNECLGDLLPFSGHGVYDPTYGQVPVSAEDAETHNRVLDGMRLDGMDKNCEIGQGSYAYLNRKARAVTTFLGTVIASGADVYYYGRGNKFLTVTFKRAGKEYRGRMGRDSEAFNFKRVK